MNKPLQRFQDRIGKTIYRDAVSCTCETCEHWTQQWITIFNESHAQYLHTVHCEMWIQYWDNDKWVEQMKDLFWFK